MNRTPLNNASIARITLQFASPEALGARPAGPNGEFIRVLEEYRQHFFLGALSSIGGLLAILQGLHVLCFGRPLLWGTSGAKFLNPFGIFGSGSKEFRKRIIARYGYSPDSGTFNVEGLSLFLSDFVLEVGPLREADDEESDVEMEDSREPLVGGTVYDAIPLASVAKAPPKKNV